MKNVKRIDENKKIILLLFLFHIAIIAISNYLVQFPQIAFGIDYTWAMFTFPLVVLATDLTIRLTNACNARMIVALAFIPAIAISIYLADWRIGLASGVAYFISQFLDIFIFKKIANIFSRWWIAPAISTVFANIVDTYTFYAIAFEKGSDEYMAENWVHIANTDLIFKIIISFIIFLPLYKLLLIFLEKKINR